MSVHLRSGRATDLEAVNAVVERAVRTWDLPERVIRLALPVYRYTEADLDTMELVLAEEDGRVLAVAGWETAHAGDTPPGRSGLLLHGVYVDPDAWGRGLGRRLLDAADEAARRRGLDGVLVKAQRGAGGFFLARGFEPLAVEDPERDYPHRLWKPLDDGNAASA